jgi:hypothetical protein
MVSRRLEGISTVCSIEDHIYSTNGVFKMKRHFFTGSIYIVLLLSVLSCAGSAKTRETPPQIEEQTETAPDVTAPPSPAPYFT